MALVLADRVRETTTTTSTGAVTLGGAYTGFQTFSAAIGNANNTYYTIANIATGEWEVGIGTYTLSTNTLSRDTVLSSSNAGSLVVFTAGTKDVFVTQPAERAVYVNAANTQVSVPELAATSITNSGLTSGRVVYSTTGGLETDSANLLYSGTDLTVYGLTVGRGAGAVATNTAVGASALAANTTGATNTAFGNGALQANTTGSSSTAVGYQAAYSNTGTDITAFGEKALFSNTTGTFNHAIGEGALFSNTTGSNNTGVGRSSLENNTTGGNNVAVGHQALISNTTASNNTAVGYQAGYSNTTATGLTAIGYQAAYSNSTGASYTTAIGWQALYANTTGLYNTAVGQSSLGANTTGGSNSSLGLASLATNTTGSSNTALGSAALYFNTTASNNTAVGYQAGYSNTTGTNNVAVGYQAGYSVTVNGPITAIGYQAGYTYNAADDWGSVFVGWGAGKLTTGKDNIVVGGNALFTNSSGAFNTAIGAASLYSNTTASNNTAVGYKAGNSNTTGTNNCAVGRFALRNCTTGTENTVLGTDAGDAITTGTDNTLVGYGAGYLMTTGSKNSILGTYSGNQGGLDIRTASNYIVLSDGDGNVRQTIDSSGNVGIGTTNPQGAKLAVSNSGSEIFQVFAGFTSNLNLIQNYNYSTSVYVVNENRAASYSWKIGTSDAMTLDASGNFGLGVTSVLGRAQFNVSDTSTTILNSTVLYLSNTGAATTNQRIDLGFRWQDGTYNGNSAISAIRESGTARLTALAFCPSNSSGDPVEKMRIDSSGNVGIGTSSLNQTGFTAPVLSITNGTSGIIELIGTQTADGTIGQIAFYNTSSSVRIAQILGVRSGANNSGALTFQTNNAGTLGERARINADGVFQVGRTGGTAGDGKLQVGATGTGAGAANTKVGFALIEDDSGNGAGLWLGSMTNENTGVIGSRTATGNIAFQTYNGGWGERARITYDGNLLVGTTSALGSGKVGFLQSASGQVLVLRSSVAAVPYGLAVNYTNSTPNNTGSQFIYCDDTVGLKMEVRSNGGIANYSANDVNLSDRREKTNFAPATSYLDKICSIPVQTFNYIDQNMEDDGGLTLGVVAQDVQAVAPELVMESNWASKDEEPKMRLSIYQTDLQYALMKCIQEQQALITSLTARITALEGA
jgi:hypothetical protein